MSLIKELFGGEGGIVVPPRVKKRGNAPPPDLSADDRKLLAAFLGEMMGFGMDEGEPGPERRAGREKSMEEILAGAEFYLKRGEALSLAAIREAARRKERYGTDLERMVRSDTVRKAIAQAPYRTGKKKHAEHFIGNLLFRDRLAKINSLPEAEQQEALDALCSEHFPDLLGLVAFTICHGESTYTGAKLSSCSSRMTEKGGRSAAVRMSVTHNGITYAAYGYLLPLKAGRANTDPHWRGTGISFCLYDTQDMLAYLTAIQQVLTEARKRMEDVLLTHRDAMTNYLPLFDGEIPRTIYEEKLLERLSARSRYYVFRNAQVFTRCEPFLKLSPFIGERGGTLRYVTDSEYIALKKEGKEVDLLEESDRFATAYKRLIFYPRLVNGAEVRAEDLFCLPERDDSSREYPLYAGTDAEDMLCYYVGPLLDAAEPVINEKDEMKRQDSERAASWQTKKGIPKATLEYMETSGFNRFFGYLEVDESCDLDKISEVYAAFTAFRERHLSWLDISKVSLRFRRLGNHRASGLYYPFIKCLCVSAREPSAFVHECGHMVDYLCGNLSQQAGFSKVYRAYEKALDKVPKESFPKGKYDKRYYLQPTEVFARSMEIYFCVIVGYTTPILGKCSGIAYPMEKEYLDEVKAFFEAFFAGKKVKAHTQPGVPEHAAQKAAERSGDA